MLNLKEYHRPKDLTEAVALLQRKQPRTVVLSGGTWLVGEAPRDVEAVVDIADLGLNRILVEGNLVRIGAAVTHQQLVESEQLRTSALRVISETAQAMSGLNIRNRATIGGAIVTADAASPLVTALLACDAEVVIAGAKDKTKQADDPSDFWKVLPLAGFLAYRRQILDEGTLITEVRMPLPSPDTRSHYARVARTPRDYPIVCAVAAFAMKDGIAGHVRIAVGGVAATPIRLSRLEFGLEKKRLADWLDREMEAQMALLDPPGDWLGSAEYRKEMARVLVRRAILAVAGAS
ncbi:MAG: FAD binding domain-containing protein [Chloroflexi bacterium]|jgi:CO/xanthine dehydrogenase FAD-binding subunit|nr:FAD binding domain-containing protein [Chloroflexota bacterium]